jgi:hypothetical protein
MAVCTYHIRRYSHSVTGLAHAFAYYLYTSNLPQIPKTVAVESLYLATVKTKLQSIILTWNCIQPFIHWGGDLPGSESHHPYALAPGVRMHGVVPPYLNGTLHF